MPRWCALCRGGEIPACGQCRRFTGNQPTAALTPQQAFTGPDLIGQHCNHFIEQPMPAPAAITPTDMRG